MEYEDFSEEEVKELLSKLCKGYFNKNFGTLTKSEIDLIMFHHYLKQKMASKTNSFISEYEISKELGISQARVRTLKTKDYLQNENKVDWKNELLEIFNSGNFVRKDGDIEVIIPDVNLMMELRNFLEEEKMINEYVLNPKVFKCTLDVFVKVYEKLKGVKIGSTYESLCSYLKKNNPKLSIETKSFKDLLLEYKEDLQTLFPQTMAIGSLVLNTYEFFFNNSRK